MQIDVSVVIPIFGTVHTERLFAGIDSLLLQTNVSLEIIISEQTTGSGIALRQRFPSIVHILSRPNIGKKGEEYNVGVARNIGLKHARGKYVYFNDADIIFFDPTYIYQLLQEITSGEILIRPPMWRMMQEEVPRFLDLYQSEGLKIALTNIVYKENYLASFSDSVITLKLVSFHDRIFSATPEQLREYETNSSLHGQENLLWQRIVHCGGILGRRKDIESIGGYATCYPVCVYEDSDLQWKLQERFIVREISNDTTYAVMHLDHDLRYRSVLQENENKNVFEKRKSRGVDFAIQKDILNF